ncbi:MAG: bacillithiol biosynthesis deacetylase BshB1 [Rhodopirellula sp. TMED11]|nr:MAG: bacillithiol biosynthesis deacetylase BshB1 [Rhodopirellula sp. TMED11]
MTTVHRSGPETIVDVAPLDMLVVAPHPDDAELGMGGTIIKMIQQGMRVGILDLTSGEPTPLGSEEIRQRETQAATEILNPTWRGNAGLPNRELQHTIESRKVVASYFRMLRPRWIFAPYFHDAHPDHVVATELIEAARFYSKLSKTDMPGERYHPERLYYYFCIHLRLAIQPHWIIDVSDQFEAKQQAIAAYHSQFVQGREEMSPTILERLESDAAYFGNLIARRYGEPFATKEPLALESMRDFI